MFIYASNLAKEIGGIIMVGPNPLVLRVIALRLEANLEHTYGHTWLQTVNVVEHYMNKTLEHKTSSTR